MCAHSMVHSDESRTGQQRRVLQGDTLRSFLANVGQSLLSSAQAPIPVLSIGIVRRAFPLAMGVASDGRLMGTIKHHTRYPSYGSTKVLRGPHVYPSCEGSSPRGSGWRIMSLGLTDLTWPVHPTPTGENHDGKG